MSQRREQPGSGKARNGAAKPAKPTAKTTRPAAKATRPAQKSSRPTGRPAAPKGRAPRRYRKSVRLSVGRTSVRLRIFLTVILLVVAIGCARAVQVQGIDSEAYAAQAAAKTQSTRTLPATRGSITDRNGVVLATTEPAMIVSIDPDMVRTNGADKRYAMSERKQAEAAAAPEAVADLLVEYLGGKKQDYLDAIATPKSRYKVVARKVPAATFTKLKAALKLGIDGDGSRPWYGVFGDSDPIRVYPNRTVASNVVGFVNAEGEGASGLEYVLNESLDGTAGSMIYDSSTYGTIPLGTSISEPAVDGASYELTLDSDLQWMVEQLLAEGIDEAGAKTGIAVVMNVKTGEVLALANGPSFDSSNPGAAETEDLGNRAVTQAYEPGSVEKVLTMAALADQGLVTPETKVVVPGRIASGDGYVRDSFSHGTLNLTAAGIVAQSSNIGTILLTRQMDKDKLSEYLEKFGLGTKSGIGLPGETNGSIPDADMADYTRDQVSFGQGLSVNAVQMTAAVAAAVNGGVYHQPTIIKSATAADGTAIELPEPVTRRVVSEEASDMVLEMMESVITLNENRAIAGYRTAGKSGTAQRYDAECMCYNGFTSSFVGVAPVEDPQLVVYVMLDKPSNGNLGSRLALPVVNNILKMALPRYNVAPSSSDPYDTPLTFD